MSLSEVQLRVEQIRSWADPAAVTAVTAPPVTGATTPASGTATGGAFAQALAQATAASATPRATGTGTATGTEGLGPDVPADLAPLIRRAAAEAGVDPSLLSALVQAESGYRSDAGSPAGARGLTQLMPATARGLGVADVLDPAQNLGGGARYLRRQLDAFGDVRLALAAYNAGPGAVTRHGGVPPYPETRAYVDRVVSLYDRNRAGTAQTETVSPT